MHKTHSISSTTPMAIITIWLFVDKKIQKVVEELKALPHEVQLKTCLPGVLL